MLRFGLPDKILHEQGGEFENHLFKELAKLCEVKRIRTRPYHPQTNRKVECMNQTIISMLQTLPELHKSKWKDHIQKLVFACNCTKHSRTKYSPYFLLFGRHPKLPIDIILPTDRHVKGTHKDHINKSKEQMKEACKVVSKHAKNKDIRHKNNSSRFSISLQPGDRVLVRNMSERGGTGKMRNFGEEKIHIIISRIAGNGVVYKVKQEHEGYIKLER